MYLTATRKDIMFAVSLISRFMESPKRYHWQVGKMIFRYVLGTINYGILYSTSSDFKLTGYTDSDFASNIDDRKNTTGYIYNIGSCAVSWESKKKPIVTISSVEAKYVVVMSTACQAGILSELLHE